MLNTDKTSNKSLAGHARDSKEYSGPGSKEKFFKLRKLKFLHSSFFDFGYQ
jgi:hypothetical protein